MKESPDILYNFRRGNSKPKHSHFVMRVLLTDQFTGTVSDIFITCQLIGE